MNFAAQSQTTVNEREKSQSEIAEIVTGQDPGSDERFN